jgi:hypothetical protein
MIVHAADQKRAFAEIWREIVGAPAARQRAAGKMDTSPLNAGSVQAAEEHQPNQELIK